MLLRIVSPCQHKAVCKKNKTSLLESLIAIPTAVAWLLLFQSFLWWNEKMEVWIWPLQSSALIKIESPLGCKKNTLDCSTWASVSDKKSGNDRLCVRSLTYMFGVLKMLLFKPQYLGPTWLGHLCLVSLDFLLLANRLRSLRGPQTY